MIAALDADGTEPPWESSRRDDLVLAKWVSTESIDVVDPGVPRRQPGEAIAFVGVVVFDLSKGPCLLCLTPSTEGLDAEAVTALEETLPFKALPENGQAFGGGGVAKKNASKAGEGVELGEGHDRCLFLLKVGKETLYGASHILRLEDPDAVRIFHHSAVVTLFRRMHYGVVLSRLHAWSLNVLSRSDVFSQLALLDAALREIRFDGRAFSFAEADLPVAALLWGLGVTEVLSLVKLLLLEGRILFVGRGSGAGAVSSAVLALAALLPGTLALGFGHDSPAFGARSYRWRKFGFPLRIFREHVVLEPHVTISDAATLLPRRGFLAGTCNAMVERHLGSRLDAVVELKPPPARSILRQLGTPAATAAFALGSRDRRFAMKLVAAATEAGSGGRAGGSNGGAAAASAAAPAAVSNGESGQWEGSSGWIVDRFQEHLEGIAAAAAACLARNQATVAEGQKQRKGREKGPIEEGGGGGGSGGGGGLFGAALSATGAWLTAVAATPMVSVETALEGWGRRWATAWTATFNFAVWSNLHNPEIANDIVAAAAAGLSRPSLEASSFSDGGSTHPRQSSLRLSRSSRHSESGGPSSSPSAAPSAGICVDRSYVGDSLGGGDGSVALPLSAATSAGSSLTLSSPRHALPPPPLPPPSSAASSSSPPPPDGVHTYTYPSGSTYVGGFASGRRHGTGVYTERSSGHTYDGEWEADLRHGSGILVSADHEYVYDGHWERDVRSGTGRCVVRGVETYSGGFLDGRYHGSGMWCGASGETYEGEFARGERQGMGRQRLPRRHGGNVGGSNSSGGGGGGDGGAGNGGGGGGASGSSSGIDGGGNGDSNGSSSSGGGADRGTSGTDGSARTSNETVEEYVGEFQAGQRWGIGTCMYPDGSRYSGAWAAGNWEGEGRLETPDGERHEGFFKSGRRHGPGMRTTASGAMFEGRWEADRPVAGDGWRLQFENGGAFVGAVSAALRPDGQGTLKLPNGDVYYGDFIDGHRQGKGLCVFAEGGNFEGEWADGTIAFGGKGRLTLPNGTTHDYT